jgi:hypothetical protein
VEEAQFFVAHGLTEMSAASATARQGHMGKSFGHALRAIDCKFRIAGPKHAATYQHYADRRDLGKAETSPGLPSSDVPTNGLAGRSHRVIGKVGVARVVAG